MINGIESSTEIKQYKDTNVLLIIFNRISFITFKSAVSVP